MTTCNFTHIFFNPDFEGFKKNKSKRNGGENLKLIFPSIYSLKSDTGNTKFLNLSLKKQSVTSTNSLTTYAIACSHGISRLTLTIQYIRMRHVRKALCIQVLSYEQVQRF